MREILFRGKKYNGEWVEGTYYKQTEYYGDKTEAHYIITSKDELEYDMMNAERVISESVGQYMEMTDKNGKRIFDGDILRVAGVSVQIGTYYYPPLDYPVNVLVKWDQCAWWWKTLCKDKRHLGYPGAWCHYECEVIGNAHDNPELLKGGE